MILWILKKTILSTNNAKFYEPNLFLKDLETNGFQFSAICIQESWLSKNNDISLFHLSNYYCISQGKTCSNKGGEIIYLNKKFKYNIKNIHTETDSRECQFIEITGHLPSKNVILGNVYRPPKNTNIDYKKFTDEFTINLALLENCNSELIIAGDYNIDLLKVNKKDVHVLSIITSQET